MMDGGLWRDCNNSTPFYGWKEYRVKPKNSTLIDWDKVPRQYDLATIYLEGSRWCLQFYEDSISGVTATYTWSVGYTGEISPLSIGKGPSGVSPKVSYTVSRGEQFDF